MLSGALESQGKQAFVVFAKTKGMCRTCAMHLNQLQHPTKSDLRCGGKTSAPRKCQN
jgi:hypothetical protein